MMPYRFTFSCFIIIWFISVIDFNFIQSVSPSSFRSEKLLINSRKIRKEMENMYVECTGALNNWSYVVKKSIEILVSDDYYKSPEIIDTIYEIGSQLLIIENSFLICKSELEINGVTVLDITERIDLDEIYHKLKLNNIKKLVIICELDKLKDRIKLLKSQYDFLKEIKTGILKFDPKDVCYKCNIFRAQLSLIGIVNKLRLVYNKYIKELEKKAEEIILESEVTTESEIYDSEELSQGIPVQLYDLELDKNEDINN
ncbi:hypothetical protein FG386_003690 [Cryptosporidium ryanae]|uniref:uncharacterized protein n=1 Tax=Cryptosporidium ryanae TaxID=515981 RepID=UPI00351A3B08|nr:hypothetical protein FG386_003690 [Cryptosporidium ryanae]